MYNYLKNPSKEKWKNFKKKKERLVADEEILVPFEFWKTFNALFLGVEVILIKSVIVYCENVDKLLSYINLPIQFKFKLKELIILYDLWGLNKISSEI